jgi:hypothetical protein
MNLKHIGLASILLVASSAASATIVFEDNFDSYTAGGSILNWDGGSNWNVNDGTVDLVRDVNPWGIDCLGDAGYCVDLDGSSGNAGEFTSLNLGPLSAGEYNFSFWMSGNQRSGGDWVISAVTGDQGFPLFIPMNITLDAGDDWAEYTVSFTLAAITNPVNIFFENQGGDNVGAMLDDVMLARVPEPATLALFGLGLLGLGAVARKKKQA